MLLERSRVKITDNSGAIIASLFAVNGKNNRKLARVGSVVKASVKKAIANGKVKKTQIVSVLIVRTRGHIRRKDGSTVYFSDNAGVIIDEKGEPKGTRIFGPIAREIRDLGKYPKVVSMASEVL